MGANVPIAGHVVATLFTFSVRPWKFEQPTLLKVDFVRKHFASRELKFPLFPFALPGPPRAGPAPLEPVAPFPPVLEEPPVPTPPLPPLEVWRPVPPPLPPLP